MVKKEVEIIRKKNYIMNRIEPKMVHRKENMKSITIHGMDEELDRKLRDKAKEQGFSLNRTIKDLLKESLGISPRKEDRRDEFTDLFNTWSKEEVREFKERIKDFESVDPKDWE